MKLDKEDEVDDEDEVEDAYEKVEGFEPLSRRRVTRQARETIVMCIVVGLIAALCWGIYKWTNASRYTPPVYSIGKSVDE